MKKFFVRVLNGKKREENQANWLTQSINHALEDIYHARARFDMATGGDNIELAIYELTAAEVRYRNLIKEAKSIGLMNHIFPGPDYPADECS